MAVSIMRCYGVFLSVCLSYIFTCHQCSVHDSVYTLNNSIGAAHDTASVRFGPSV